jgi:arylsulfatase A-like enzyme
MTTTGQGNDGAAPARVGFGRLAVITLWFALTAALLELVVHGTRRYLLGDVLRVSRDVLWMAPLGQLLLFIPLAAVVTFVALARRKPPAWPHTVGAFSFIAMFGVLSIPQGLHPLAAALLAAGVAIQSARLVAAHPTRFDRLVRRMLPVQVLGLTLAAGGSVLARTMVESRAVADLPPASRSAPNVLLLIWDTVRAGSLSLHGHTRTTTPNLDRIARGGVVFDRAIATAPWTLPSHASMFTGYPPHRLTAGWTTPLDDTRRTLAEAFHAAGYVTGGFAANVLYTDWEHGLARGFVHYEDYTRGLGQIFLSTSLGFRIAKGRHGWERGPIPYVVGYRQFVGRRLGESVDEEFLQWIDERGDLPFFAFLNYFDAHLPYEPPPPFDTLFGPPRPESTVLERLEDVARGRTFWSDITNEELAAELAAYEGSIAYLDHRLGILYDELARRDLTDNTIIVLTSDHGEEFLEHGDHEHGSNLYLPQLHVPLVVLYPDHVPAGLRIAEPVSLQHLPATLAELSGLSDRIAFPGRSLSDWWARSRQQEADLAREIAYSELKVGTGPAAKMHSIIAAGHHYIRNTDGRGELYEIFADPAEQNDLAAAAADAVEVWSDALDGVLSCAEPACCCQVPASRGLPSPSLLPQREQ